MIDFIQVSRSDSFSVLPLRFMLNFVLQENKKNCQ
jgi:hypothetical protein